MLGKYELNNIYNEDSYKAIKDIPDNSVDCIYTDIPYLYDNHGKGNSMLAKRIDKISKELQVKGLEDGIEFSILDEFIRISKKVNMFIWCSRLQIPKILYYLTEKGYNFNILTWNKTNPTPSTNGNWLPDIEYCLCFSEKGVVFNNGYHLKNKWDSSSLNKKDKDLFEHPNIKPLQIVKRHLLHMTQPNDIVADFFLGSGTTAVACKETGRQYIGFEIDKEYYDIAKNRLNGITANGQTSIFTDFTV